MLIRLVLLGKAKNISGLLLSVTVYQALESTLYKKREKMQPEQQRKI
jgi:hypothetical protein